MKKSRKIISVVLSTSLLLAFQVSQVFAAPVEAQPNLVSLKQPVKAENVEIVKKVTLKGLPAKPVKNNGLAATDVIGAPLPEGGKKFAIVIGISDYPGTASDLTYADVDAIAVEQVLVKD